MTYKNYRVPLPLLILVFFSTGLLLSAQDADPESPRSKSYADNEFQILARRYTQWAEEAIANGNFDASIEYSALAQENAALSEAYVSPVLAERRILRAETLLAWAEKNPIIFKVKRPEPAIVPAAADESDDAIDEVDDVLALSEDEYVLFEEEDSAPEDSLAEGDTVAEDSAAVSFESPAEVFTAVKEALALAHTAFDSKDFKTAVEQAQVALDALAWLSDDPWRIGDPGLPRYYVVREWSRTRDCFWNISGKPFVYGSPWQWRRIYNANKAMLVTPANPNRMAPGTVLEIPVRSGETRNGTYDSARK